MSIHHEVAVVILNWNGEKFLQRFLPGVLANSNETGVAVYVADNGSTDGSVKLIRSRFPLVNLILLDRNYGYAGGYNRALSQIDSDFFVLLNSDVEVPGGWLNPLRSFMRSNPNAAACAPAIMDIARPECFEYAGAAGGFIDKFGYPFCRGRILSEIEQDTGQYNQSIVVFWASGACMMVRANTFWDAGGFDDHFFAHMEEIDLCWRMLNMGYSVWSIPESKVYHVGGGTLPNNNPYKLYLNYRNSLFMLHKNLSKNAFYQTIIARLLLDWLSAMAYLVRFQLKFFGAVVKSHYHYYRNISRLNSFRSSFRHPKTNSAKVIYHRSVLFDFFILRRRKFSELKF